MQFNDNLFTQTFDLIQPDNKEKSMTDHLKKWVPGNKHNPEPIPGKYSKNFLTHVNKSDPQDEQDAYNKADKLWSVIVKDKNSLKVIYLII